MINYKVNKSSKKLFENGSIDSLKHLSREDFYFFCFHYFTTKNTFVVSDTLTSLLVSLKNRKLSFSFVCQTISNVWKHGEYEDFRNDIMTNYYKYSSEELASFYNCCRKMSVISDTILQLKRVVKFDKSKSIKACLTSLNKDFDAYLEQILNF